MPLSERIQKLAAEWLEWDKNPNTSAEIRTLLEKGDEAELERRLGSRIAFGTAGSLNLHASSTVGVVVDASVSCTLFTCVHLSYLRFEISPVLFLLPFVCYCVFFHIVSFDAF